VLSKSVELEFNEDAVRSNSSAYIVFGNKNGNREHHAYQFFCNDELVGEDGYRVQATTKPQQLSLKVKIHPSIGDSTEMGYLSIYGSEIDEVNSIALTEEGWQRIAQWSFTQEIGLPWLIWLIWLLLLLIAVAIIVLVIYLLIQYVIIPLGAFLSNAKVDALICGGIGQGARNVLNQAGIEIYPGATGDVDEVCRAFISGNLNYQPDYECHDHDHEGHDCGSHDCGSHHC
jgi:hypothetical protein